MISNINYNLFSNSKCLLTIYAGLLLLAIIPIIFRDHSIDLVFITSSMGIVVVTSLYYSVLLKISNFKNFLVSIFIISLILRIISVFIYYEVFYRVTGTPFEVTFADSLFYDRMGREFADMIRNGNFSIISLLDLNTHPDRIGYQVFLGVIYYFTNDSIVIARIIQAFISAYTVIISFKIGEIIWNKNIAKFIAILFSGFPPFLLYSTLHLREFLLVFIFLSMLFYFLKLMNSYSFKNLLLLLFFVVCMLFLRTVFLFVFLAAIGVYLVIYQLRTPKNIAITGAVFFCVFAILAYFPVFDASWIKILGYLGLEEDVRLGGYSQELVVSRGMSLAEYIGGPLFIIPSFVFPMPSLLKLNIESFGQTIHWYFTGGLIIWVFYSCFFYTGMYRSYKNKNKEAIFVVILIILMSVALLESFYFTSIRFNQVKMALLLFFIPSGMIYFRKKNNLYAIYIFAMIGVIIAYNYLRIFGRT